jgi:hypothetical protein
MRRCVAATRDGGPPNKEAWGQGGALAPSAQVTSPLRDDPSLASRRRVGGFEIADVEARATTDDIAARAVDRVEHIGPGTSAKVVVTRAADQRVTATATDEKVPAPISIEKVIPSNSADRVIAAPGVDAVTSSQGCR